MAQQHPSTGVTGSGRPPYEEEFRSLGEILERDREQILRRWYDEVTTEQVHPDPSRRAEVMDHMVEMLQALGQRLQEQSGQALAEAARVARVHGRQRADIGWDIAHVVRDYEILHTMVLEHLGERFDERLTYRQAMALATVMGRAQGSAVEAFSEMAEKALHKQVERQREELRQSTLALTESEHRERRRIARRIHDNFQQLLTAGRMKLDAALGVFTEGREHAEQARELLDKAIAISRDVMADLYSDRPEKEDLPAAIERLREMVAHWYGLRVDTDVQLSADDVAPESLRQLVHDALRELLLNVAKHAETDRAWVRVHYGDDRRTWRVTVEDAGVGFSEPGEREVEADDDGFGLADVRRRIEHVGGSMEVRSAPGEGTRVALTVPLDTAVPRE